LYWFFENITFDVVFVVHRNCPHCVALNPIFEEIAKDYSQDPTVVIGQFNTHGNDVPTDVEVKYVPTLILFKNCGGATKLEQVPFKSSNRTFTELTTFINENKC